MNNDSWREKLNFDPLAPLIESDNDFIKYFVNRDFLRLKVKPLKILWNSPVVEKIFKKQQKNGSWKSTSASQKKFPAVNYSLSETWKKFRFAVEQFQMNKSDPRVKKAAEYIFSCQTDEGDIRGILANQKTIYYTGAIISLLIQAGYEQDPRLIRGIRWLLDNRQDDGGWMATPMLTLDFSWKKISKLSSDDSPTIEEHNKSKPSSHNWTGMVIRAFANHPDYRYSPEAKKAGINLKEAFFSKDKHYTWYKDAGYWVRFQFPFWWNHLVAAMDSLSKMGFSSSDQHIKKGLNWFIEHQEQNGLWNLSYSKKHKMNVNKKSKEMQLWIDLSICKIFKRFFPN